MYALFTFFLPLVSHILKYIRDCYWAQLVFSLNIRSRSSSLHLYSFSVLMHICILSNERTNEIHLRFWPFLLLGHIIHTASKSFLFRTLTNILQHTTILGNRLTFYYALQYAAAPKETITENRFPNVFIHFLLPMLLLLLFSRFLSVLSAMNIHTLDFSFWYSIVVLRCVWVCECVCRLMIGLKVE